jgi:small conductance mechanosensitive channel
MTNQLQTLEQMKATAVDLGIRFGPKVLVAIIILTVGFFVARAVGRWAQRYLGHFRLEPPVRILLVRLIRLLVMGLFILMALTNLDINLIPLIAGLSVAGAGIALAMQGVLGNLAAGMTIIFTKPFRVGEYIELLGVQGEVITIELFSTTLLHPDKSRVVIPNRKIVGEVLHNYGTIRQLNLTVGVAYGTNIEQALAIIRGIITSNPRVLKDPSPVAGVAQLADSSINLSVRPWTTVADYGPAGPEIYQTIVNEFRAQRIEIPFPQREIRMLEAAAK